MNKKAEPRLINVPEHIYCYYCGAFLSEKEKKPDNYRAPDPKDEKNKNKNKYDGNDCCNFCLIKFEHEKQDKCKHHYSDIIIKKDYRSRLQIYLKCDICNFLELKFDEWGKADEIDGKWFHVCDIDNDKKLKELINLMESWPKIKYEPIENIDNN